MAETGLTKTRVLSELMQSHHGDLKAYLPIGGLAARQDPEFYAHLIACTAKTSEVKDVRMALPIIGLALAPSAVPFGENAAAHLAQLDPKLFLRAMEFGRAVRGAVVDGGRAVPVGVGSNLTRRLVTRYLRDKEADGRAFTRVAVQHRGSLRRLYALYHVKPSAFAESVVLRGEAPDGTVFSVIRRLATMTPTEAAGAIMKHKIPFLIASGALKQAMKSTDVVMALIQQMTPAELVTNTKLLNRLGVQKEPALRAALEAALEKAGTSKKRTSTFKTSRAADHVGDAKLATKLRALQEKQLARVSIDGDWLVLGDKSSSMKTAIEAACQIAATLARTVKGQVHLVFFDTSPRYVEATGKTLDELKQATAAIRASGNTSIGCGLMWALEKKIRADGIAIVSDGGENHAPMFAPTYARYAEMVDGLPPVYLYLTPGSDPNRLTPNCAAAGIDVQEFDLTGPVDYYSLGGIIQTMRASRYGLVDEVMEQPLLTLDGVLTHTVGQSIWANAEQVVA